MKVLIAASIYPPDAGGPATHAKAQFEEFPKLGVETELVALAHYRKWPPFVRHYLYFLKLFSLAWKCDVIYAHDAWGTGFPALLVATILNKKLIVRVGGDLAWERAAENKNISLMEWYAGTEYKKNLMYRLSYVVLKSADRIIVTSNLLKGLYEKNYGIAPSKIKVILNPVEKSEVKVLQQERTIIFASRLVSYKNLDSVLRALAPVLKEDKNLRLVLMGDGPEKARLEKVSSNLEIESQVEFTGHVPQEEVVRRTASCLFTLAPAFTEFNPNYVLQGIGMGKPFLISWEHGLPFEVPEFLRFNASSEEELRQKTSNLLSKKEYAEAQAFASSIEIKTSWKDSLRQNVEVIQEVLKGLK